VDCGGFRVEKSSPRGLFLVGAVGKIGQGAQREPRERRNVWPSETSSESAGETPQSGNTTDKSVGGRAGPLKSRNRKTVGPSRKLRGPRCLGGICLVVWGGIGVTGWETHNRANVTRGWRGWWKYRSLKGGGVGSRPAREEKSVGGVVGRPGGVFDRANSGEQDKKKKKVKERGGEVRERKVRKEQEGGVEGWEGNGKAGRVWEEKRVREKKSEQERGRGEWGRGGGDRKGKKREREEMGWGEA